MGSGYQTPKQEAAALNVLFQQQAGESGAINGMIVVVVKHGGKETLTLIILPKNLFSPTATARTVGNLPTDVKSVGKPASQSCNPAAADSAAQQAIVGGTFVGAAGMSVGTIFELAAATAGETGGLSVVVGGFLTIVFGNVGGIIVRATAC